MDNRAPTAMRQGMTNAILQIIRDAAHIHDFVDALNAFSHDVSKTGKLPPPTIKLIDGYWYINLGEPLLLEEAARLYVKLLIEYGAKHGFPDVGKDEQS